MRKPKKIRLCKNCGKPGVVKKYFCSKKCSAEHRSNTLLLMTKEELEKEHNKNDDVIALGKFFNCSIQTIYKYLKKYNIPHNRIYEDFTGRQLGDVYVIGPIRVKTKSREDVLKWQCSCSCGRIFIRSTPCLLICKSFKCPECAKSIRPTDLPLTKYIYGFIKRGAESRNLAFEVTRERMYDLLIQQDFKCALTGVDIYLAKDSKEYNKRNYTASLDRIDSSKGYIEGNVQWVHKIANVIKWTLPEIELHYWASKITKHLKKKLGIKRVQKTNKTKSIEFG